MIAELPDGQTATFRDQLMRGDIREARRGMVFITAPDGSRRTDGAFLDDLTGRIIRIMLVDWSLPLPKPRDAAERGPGAADPGRAGRRYLLGTGSGGGAVGATGSSRSGRRAYQFVHTASGVTVEVTDPADAREAGRSSAISRLLTRRAQKRSADAYRDYFCGIAGPGPTPTE